jgi:hypothetical protein
MSTLDDLVAARALIAKPDTWCIGRLFGSEPTGLVSYCAIGAINKAVTGSPIGMVFSDHGAAAAVLAALPPAFGHDLPKLAIFNNTHTHTEVLALFDRAIERQRLIEQMGEASATKELEIA